MIASFLTHSAISPRFAIPSEADNTPNLSILNFPPLLTPPSRDSDQDVERPISPFLLHAAFEGWARSRPEAVALDFVHSLPSASTEAEHSVLTYGALNTAATRLAARLRELCATAPGTDEGRIIPIYMTTSPELYICYLAVLKAGYAFSPIPQDAPEQRVREILEDIASPVILGNTPEPPSGPWRLDDSSAPTWIDVPEVTGWRKLQGETAVSADVVPFEAPEIKPDQTAYLLFTSGSTGKPKGVQVHHMAVTCSIESHSTAIPLPGNSAGDFRWFQFAAPTFDPSLMEIFVTLSSGATLCSANRSLTLTDLEGTINEARATIMMATPSLAALLRPSHLTTLQSLWTMGEKLNRTVIDNFATRPHANGTTNGATEQSRMLVNAYGPTEGAINCTFLGPVEYSVRGSIIGHALPTCSMLVLDPDSHLPKAVPAGLAGELAIGGPQVSKGYLNRPKETAKAFVYSPEFGYVYRTGDMARIVWDETGCEVLEFLGRITSDQVKVSGRRLELGEIESVLATVSGVTEVVAVVSKRDQQTQGSEHIVACLVTANESDKQVIVKQAHETTHRHLSDYMCPSFYAFFEALPRSSSGKVDRKAIAAKLQQESSDIQTVSPPRASDANGSLADWDVPTASDLLSLQQLVISLLAEATHEDASVIKPDASLYSLGVDSLGAMRLLQKFRDNSITGLSVGDILQAETPRALVSTVLRVRQSEDSTGAQAQQEKDDQLQQRLVAFNAKNLPTCAERLGLSADQIEKVLPTTATQSGMLASFLRSSSDKTFETRSYIYHSVLPLGEGVDIERVKNAWDTVTRNYDSFRTAFCWLDDDMAPFAQCIIAPGASSEQHWNIYNVSEESSEEETMQTVLRHAENTISLSTPPWAISIIQTPEKCTFILSMFHGIFDGGSLQLLLEDVSCAYEGKPLVQRTSLEHIVKHHFQADHAATATFWQQHLDNHSSIAFPSVTPFRPPTAKKTDAVEITARTGYDDLKKLSRKSGSTPLSVLQAAWASVLLAYTGTPDLDVVIGSVVSGRLDPESEACIGPTFTTVPVRLSLNQIAKTGGDAWTNQSVARHLTSFNAKTLSHLQPRLGSLVTADGKLPYDTLLAYQDFNAGSSESSLWTSIHHPPMANDFAVMVEVWPDVNSSLTLRASFNHAQLDRDAAEMMLRQLDDIVAFILERPDEDFLTSPLSTQVGLKSSCNTDAAITEASQTTLIHTQFEEHARSNPEDLALIFKGDLEDENSPLNITWTYAEMNARAARLAQELVDAYGPLTNKAVPICIEKSPALYVAILGILKAGGAWCPIDTFSPAQRRHDLIVRTESKLLLVSSADGAQPENAVPAGIDVVDVSPLSGKEPVDAPAVDEVPQRASPSDMAYLIWTSGTTGAPKGVPITHSAGVSSMRSLQKDIPTDVTGGVVRCLQFSAYTFDVSVQDIFYTWGVGGVLISASREIMLGSFSQLANITGATHAHLTPAFSAGVSRKSCKTLEVITMIGEKLTQPVADDWGTDMRAYNTYGPAEATVVSTLREFGNESKNIKSANIGWPLDTVSVFVTRNQKMVMKNAVGELALGGPQLSPGYLNQDDVTRAKYVWNEEASQRVYYTGDLVRMLADGSLEYINRVDDLVKLGGIRVELSEISYSLGECHPLVENIETLIINRPDRPAKVVVAFLSAPGAVSEDDKELLLLNDASVEIARAASEQAHSVLPDHMIPSVYLVVRSIPRTQSAKTDRRALQAAYASVDIEDWETRMNPGNGLTDGLVDEGNATTVAQIVETISALANISPSIINKTSRLGSLGIDSIHAIRLASRLNEAGYRLSVVDVLHCVNVQDLVNLASASTDVNGVVVDAFDVEEFNQHWVASVKSKVKDELSVVKATTIQESLLSETMGTYNMYWSNHFVSLDSSVDITRLRQAWFAVSQKTEALRTGFVPVAEIGSGNVADNLDFSLLQLIYAYPLVDWESYECTDADWREVLDSRLEAVMNKHQANYFRLPPWAVTILDKGNERIAVFTVHHSIYDGPSLEFIMDDVRSAYGYKPPTRNQMRDALSVVLPTDQRSAETREFWQTELEKFSQTEAPVWPDLTGKRIAPGTEPEHKFLTEEILLTEPAGKLQSAANKLGVSSIASIIRAAWGCVCLAYFGAPTAVLAETLSDRVLDATLENCIGPLLSVVPVPFHPQGTARELLADQHRISVQSWKYRHIHAREVRKMLKRARGEPLYPAIFTFHITGEQSGDNSSGINIWTAVEDPIGLHVEHPMAVNVFQRPDGALMVEASADSAIISQEQLFIFARQIDAFVSAMIAHPDEPVTQLVQHFPRDLLAVSNQVVSQEVANSVNLSPTHWLEQYAKTNPDWTAVEAATAISEDGIEKEGMSFGELNAAANRVAAFIASLGHKNRMIAICAGRNLASYPVTIGIYKSGNAYLPIDENLPNDRKTFLVEDGESPIVFTESTFSATFADVPESCRVICIDDPSFQETVASMPSEDRDYQSHPDDLSYLLYTSGSTGKPKGVMITRGNLSSFIESLSEFICDISPETMNLGGKGRWIAQASRAFDPHIVEMFFPWRHGMATVTGPRMMLLDNLQLTMSKWDITHGSLVPSVLDQTNTLPEHCPSMVYLSVGGEKISQKVLDTWGLSPNVALANAYGPTEVTIGCTFAHVKPDTNLRNIGPPLTACTGHVFLPGTMTYALRGQTGELCFSGDLVGRGYLNRPDAKGYAVGPNGEKMYRTGDIGRLMPDDSVEYLGRGDDQTKIRGQRLELGEVSEVLRASSTIDIDVATTVVQHPGLSRVQLISFVSRSNSVASRSKAGLGEKGYEVTLLQSDIATLGKELQEACAKKVPSYMVPEIVLPVTFIPLAAMSGKVDMKPLHAIFANLPLPAVLQGNNAGAPNESTYTDRPLNDDEQAVVNEICAVVATDRSIIRPMTNIFEVGIDSLSAINVSVKLRNIGYDASVARVMSNPVIEQLARLPRSTNKANGDAATAELRQRLEATDTKFRQNAPESVDLSRVASVRPCLPLQEGLVARSINSEGRQLYVNHIALQLAESIDAEQLKNAWQAAAVDNEILRTSFAALDQEMVQVLFSVDSYEIRWEEEEAGNLEEAIAILNAQQESISQDIMTNISAVPPVRFVLIKSSASKQPLLLDISIHHALYDGESFSMLIEEVAARYANDPVPERGSPSSFIEHVYSQDIEKAKQHWTTTLAGCHPTVFQSDSNVTENSTVVHRLVRSKLSQLERCSANLKTTVPSLVQATFGLLLADLVDAGDVTYGTVLSGRAVSVPGADSVLLPCITTIPGRLDTSGLCTVDDVVATVQKSAVKSLEFQHTSLRHIQRWLKSETPLFDCLFSFIRSTSPSKYNFWSELESHMPADYPFAVEAEADSAADVVHLNCRFSTSFGATYSAEEFLEKMDAVLSSVVAGENVSLENFNLSQPQSVSSQTSSIKWDENAWSAEELKIQEMVASFCGLDKSAVSKGASFLALGIDSVTAIQFSRNLRDAGFNASSSDVMRFACVGALAAQLCSQESKEEDNTARPSIDVFDAYQSHVPVLGPNDSVSAMFSCTPLQSSMITGTLGSAGAVYVHPHPVRLADDVDIPRLKEAISRIIQANDILRTSFHSIEELGYAWVGAVHTSPALNWHEITLPSTVDPLSEISSMFRFGKETAFEVPPIRSVLVTRPTDKLLVIVMHHALYDGASLPFVFEDLARAYQDDTVSERPQFSETVSYVHTGQEQATEFWTQKLVGYEVAELPRLPASDIQDQMFMSERRVGLDIANIIEACKAMEVTVQSVSLLAYAKVLTHLLGKRDVVFGQVLAGRSLPTPGVERTIGPLFNTVAQRVTFEPKFLSNKAMARRLQQLTTDSQVYQHAPLRTVQNRLRQIDGLKSASLFDTLFVFQKSADIDTSVLDGQQIWTPYNADDYAAQAEHKINIEIDHARDGIVARATCNGQYLSQSNLDESLELFSAVFQDIIEHPTRCATVIPDGLGDLPLRLSVEEVKSPEVEQRQASDVPAHESLVREILADAASVSADNIAPDTSIFNIGLDSLSAIRIASICRSKGLKAGVADILQGNTLRGISQRIQPTSRSNAQAQGPLLRDYNRIETAVLGQLGLEKNAIETILPCLGGQVYHLASWIKSGRTLFEPAWSYYSTERIDGAQLEKAWLQLRQRHPILRTCFAVTSPSEAYQVVMKHAGNDTFKVIKSSLTVTEAAKEQAREEVLHPSSLFVPPVRLRLLKASDRDGIQVLINHAAYDAWTMPMFVTELAKLYRGEAPETNPNFPSFVDYSVRSVRGLDEAAYWSSIVGSSTPTLIKGGQASGPDEQLFVGAWEKVKNLAEMENACRSAGLGLQSVVLLAVSRFLARSTGVDSPTMGLYQTGRSASFTDIERLSGPCLNVTPFVVPNAERSNTGMLEKVRGIQSSLAKRVSYEQSSLRDILLRWASTKRTQTPLFNAWVNLLWMQPQAQGNGELFQPLRIGVPTDFIPSEPLPPVDEKSTSVAALDTSYIPDANVYIDIGPDVRTNTIGFGVRVEGGLLTEGEVQEFVSEIGREIESIVSSVE